MQTSPVVTFKGLEPSAALRDLIEHRVADLEQHHPRITSCRVVVEQPHHKHQQGESWQIKITIEVPGSVVVVNHEPARDARHEDAYAAVRDAFDAARRRLQHHGERRAGHVKHHEEAPVARVIAVAADHGFLATEDGRQVYFHANAVLQDGFTDLHVGSPVSFVEEEGEEGPQASAVRRLA